VQHLAGKTRGLRLEEFLAVNEAGVDRLCAAAVRTTTPPVVVVVSSLAVVGPSPPGEPHTESTPCRPISMYGRSKLAGEHAARRHADRLPISIVRPPVVFGPGDRAGLMLFKTIRRLGFHFVPQMQGLPLSAVYADDLVDALIRVGESGERCHAGDELEPDDPRGVYFAGSPEPTSYADIGRMAAAALGQKAWVLCRRKYPLLPAAWAGDIYGRITGKAPLLGTDKLREASASGWVCRSDKLSALGWAPSKPLAEQYAATADWYRHAGWL
ncbi:MAG: NAD(P)-dependent oxidoreductase, partial [Planctomycetota bacterium]